MSVWHDNALKAVHDNLLGHDIIEVVHKMPWGFDEIKRRAVTAEDYIISPCRSDTTILHILCGEGVPLHTVRNVLIEAMKYSTRVLILEHNPDSDHHKHNDHVNWPSLRSLIDAVSFDGYKSIRIDIDGRNLLYVITSIQGADESFNRLNNNNKHRDLKFQYRDGLPEKDRNIFCLSSERQPGSERLLTDDAVMVIDSSDSNAGIYSVIGGMMFLNLLAELGISRRLTLFDVSLPQVLYAMTVTELIKANETVEDFDSARHMTAEGIKISSFCNAEQLITWMKTAKHKIPRPDKGMELINIVKTGHWRQSYSRVRDELLRNTVRFHHGGMPGLKVPAGSILYTSTVEPQYYDDYKGVYIIEAYSMRDVPRLRYA